MLRAHTDQSQVRKGTAKDFLAAVGRAGGRIKRAGGGAVGGH